MEEKHLIQSEASFLDSVSSVQGMRRHGSTRDVDFQHVGSSQAGCQFLLQFCCPFFWFKSDVNMPVSIPLQPPCPCRVTRGACQVSKFVCVCLFNNSVGMLITRLCCCSCPSRLLLTSHQHLFFHTQLSCLAIAVCCSPLLALPLKSSLMYSILAFFGTKRFPFLSFISFHTADSLSSLHHAMPFSNELFSAGQSHPLRSVCVPCIVLLISWTLLWVYHIPQCFQLLKEANSPTYNVHISSHLTRFPSSPPVWLIPPQHPALTDSSILAEAPGWLDLIRRNVMECLTLCVVPAACLCWGPLKSVSLSQHGFYAAQLSLGISCLAIKSSQPIQTREASLGTAKAPLWSHK